MAIGDVPKGPPLKCHRGHFYGGQLDGQVLELYPFCPTVKVPVSGGEEVYHHVARMGAEKDEDCRDHIFRFVMTKPSADDVA